jgi:hypothetical protein
VRNPDRGSAQFGPQIEQHWLCKLFWISANELYRISKISLTHNEPSVKIIITPSFFCPVNCRFQTIAMGMRYITISVAALIPAIATQTRSGPEQDPAEIIKSLVSGTAFQAKKN